MHTYIHTYTSHTQATDKDGRSLMHIVVDIKEQDGDRAMKQAALVNKMLQLGADATSVDFFGKELLHNVEKQV